MNFSALTEAHIQRVAKRIYEANHGGFEGLPGRKTAPAWEAASENVQAFCIRQAEAAIRVLYEIQEWPLTSSGTR